MDWVCTVRFDASTADDVLKRLHTALSGQGVRVTPGAAAYGRGYALLEGAAGTDPASLENALPDALWYREPIIAVAIEPGCEDALSPLAQALGGSGAPPGVLACDRIGKAVLVDIAYARTPPALVLEIADVELRRFGGGRRTQLLTPLDARASSAIAAQGLGCAEIAPDRILEMLLERTGVE